MCEDRPVDRSRVVTENLEPDGSMPFRVALHVPQQSQWLCTSHIEDGVVWQFPSCIAIFGVGEIAHVQQFAVHQYLRMRTEHLDK